MSSLFMNVTISFGRMKSRSRLLRSSNFFPSWEEYPVIWKKSIQKFLPKKISNAFVLDKEALLFNEFDRIITDLFGKRAPIYKQIIRALSQGPSTFQTLLNKLEMPKGGTFSDYLHNLELNGYIARDHTWSIPTGEQMKLNRYRLRDNYLRFYLKYIEPNRTKIERQKLLTTSLMGFHYGISV